MKRHAVLVDCRTRSGLAVLRSLARHDVPQTAIATHAENMVFRSRYLRNKVLAPPLETDGQGFVDCLVEVINQLGDPVVIPMTDQATVVLDGNRDRIPEQATLALCDSVAISRVLNKSESLSLARELNIPCPRTVSWSSELTIEELIDTLGLPLVVKNPYPESVEEARVWPFRFYVAHDARELSQCLQSIEKKRPRPIFQEYVSGVATNICSFAVKGAVLATHQYVSRRRSSHTGILREIVPLRSDLAEYTHSMLGRLKWTGAAHLGFIESFDGDKIWYMETNGRFWASVQGSIHAGWNIPLWLYEYYSETKKPAPSPIQIGSQTCYRPGDLDILIDYMAGGQSPTFYTDPGKWRAVGQYLTGFHPGIHSDVCDWRDPLPCLMDYGRVLKDIGERGIQKLFGF